MDERRIVFFDGVCNLCNSSVRFLFKIDKKQLFQFAHLQSEIASKLLPSDVINNSKLDSVIYYRNHEYLVRSLAVLEMCNDIGFPWNLLNVLKLIPVSILDKIYNYIAANRYKWFGRPEKCLIPNDDILSRFIQ